MSDPVFWTVLIAAYLIMFLSGGLQAWAADRRKAGR